MSEVEVYAALCNEGIADLEEAEAVVLETDGTFSVIRNTGESRAGNLENVFGYPPEPASSSTPARHKS